MLVNLFSPIPWAPALLLAALGADASAQSPTVHAGSAERIPSQVGVRHAGTYHVVSGTWDRRNAQFAAIGPDTIYCNTAGSGYFSGTAGPGGLNPGSENVDEGIVPVRGNPDWPLVDRASYTVNCFEIGYCDLGGPAVSGWEIRFFEAYEPCSAPPATATATISTMGLPAGGSCWTINIDLSGGQEFELLGEGGGGPGTDVDPHFGWSYRYIGTGTSSAGFLLTGDPANTNPPGFPLGGTGTYYGPPSLCSSGSTGLGTEDQWFTAGTINQCFFFGGYNNSPMCGLTSNPFASWHIEIFAEAGPGNSPAGSTYCAANPNSTGVPSTLALTGSSSAAGNNVLLQAEVPPRSFGVFQTSLTQAFVPNFMGSAGDLCLGGTVSFFSSPGQVRNSGPDGVLLLDTQLSAWDLAAIPDGSTAYAAAAGLTANFQCWHRDVGSSNFTNAVSVIWTP